MAVVDRNGNTINLGDRVRTEDGKVIVVEGVATANNFYDASKCEKLDGVPVGSPGRQASSGADGDSIIWGS